MTMQYEWLMALIALCAITLITPGPNNFIVLSGSISKWIKKTLPAYLWVCLGFTFMVFILWFVVAFVGTDVFQKIEFIKYFGIAFLLYLSYKIFTSKKTNKDKISQKYNVWFPHMFFFQWMNPKAWAMIMSTVSLVWIEYYYLPGIVFGLIVFPAVWVWLVLWDFIGKKIIGTKYELYTNKVLAILLALSVYFMV